MAIERREEVREDGCTVIRIFDKTHHIDIFIEKWPGQPSEVRYGRSVIYTGEAFRAALLARAEVRKLDGWPEPTLVEALAESVLLGEPCAASALLDALQEQGCVDDTAQSFIKEAKSLFAEVLLVLTTAGYVYHGKLGPLRVAILGFLERYSPATVREVELQHLAQ